MDRNRDSALTRPLFWLVLRLIGAGEFQSAPYTAVANALPGDPAICGGLASGRRRQPGPQRTVTYPIAPDSRVL